MMNNNIVLINDEKEVVLDNKFLGKFEIISNADDCKNILEYHYKDNYITLYNGNKAPRRKVDITKINIDYIITDYGYCLTGNIELDNVTHLSGSKRPTLDRIHIEIKNCNNIVRFSIVSNYTKESIDILYNATHIDDSRDLVVYNNTNNKVFELFEDDYSKNVTEFCKKYLGGKTIMDYHQQQQISAPLPPINPNNIVRLMVKDVESQIFALEGIRIVFRISSNTILKSYDYSDRYGNGKTVIDWIKDRIIPLCVNEVNMPVYIDYDIIANDRVIVDKTITMKQLRKLTNKPMINNDITEESIMKNAIVDNRNIEEPVINWE